jgi:hypothetical protein
MRNTLIKIGPDVYRKVQFRRAERVADDRQISR